MDYNAKFERPAWWYQPNDSVCDCDCDLIDEVEAENEKAFIFRDLEAEIEATKQMSEIFEKRKEARND